MKRCGFDRKTGSAGIATSYWRWRVTDDTVVGYRLYTCLDHTLHLIETMGVAATPLFMELEDMTCVKCGAEWHDGDPEVWGYVYAPKSDRVDYSVPLCHECIDAWVEPIRHSGQILADRVESARARSDNPWGSIIPVR